MKSRVCGELSRARLMAGGVALLLLCGLVFSQEGGGAQEMPEMPEMPAETGVDYGAEPATGLESEELIDRAQALLKELTEDRVRRVSLSLSQCVALAVQNNFDVRIERIAPLRAAEDLVVAQADFDPSLVSGVGGEGALLSLGASRSASSFSPGSGFTGVTSGTESDTATAGLSLVQPLYTGGSVSLGYGMGYVETDPPSTGAINPQWSAQAALVLSHPLLRGAGLDYNLANIRVTRNNRAITYEEFRNQMIGIIFDVESAYWNLVRGIEDLRVSLKSLQVAVDNRQSSWLQYKAGTQPRLEVTTGDAGVADRLSRLYQSEVAVRDLEDELKHQINLPDDWYLEDLHVSPLSKPREDVADPPVDLDLSRAIAVALKCRPEVQQVGIDIRSNQIIERRRRNELLPQLNVELQLAYEGLNSNHENAASQIPDRDFYDHRAALSFRYPLGNRAAKANLRNARLATRRAKLDSERISQIIVLRVRAALRRIETDRQRVLATRKGQELHAERLEAEQRKKEVGRSTSFTVLQVEEEYVSAQRDYVNALLDYQISLANYDRELGTLLDVRNIEIENLVEDGELGERAGQRLFQPSFP